MFSPQNKTPPMAQTATRPSLKHFVESAAVWRADEADRDGRASAIAIPYRRSLFTEAIEDVDQLRQALRGFGFSPNDAVGDALLDVVAEHRQADPVQRRFG